MNAEKPLNNAPVRKLGAKFEIGDHAGVVLPLNLVSQNQPSFYDPINWFVNQTK